jgi:DNA mismatch repair ATPase MutL
MKLSTETLGVLKNFGNINSGIFLKQGKTVKTVSSHKNILAQATIPDEIPSDFGIYDLNEFLSVVSLHKDDLSLDFDSKNVVISGRGGRSKIKYRACESTMITVPPEKQLQMPDAEIKFELSAEDFRWILDAANVLGSPQISVESDGEKVTLNTIDTTNDSAHTESLEIDLAGNGANYKMVFKTENLTKILTGSYDVSVSSKGVSHFKNKKFPIEYWITTEVGSTYKGV